MRCSKVTEDMMAYVAGELSASESAEMRLHLDRCDGCRAEMEAARRAHDALSFLREEEPAPELVSSVRERISAERIRRAPALRLGLAMAASVLIVAAVVAGWLRSQAIHPQTPVAVEHRETIPVPVEKRQAVVPEERGPSEQPTVSRETPEGGGPVVARRPIVRRVPKLRTTDEGPKPVEEPLIAEQPEESPGEAPGEPFMFIALTPREPESYKIAVSSEEENTSSELTVVRQFDVGGNVTEVTIDQTTTEGQQVPGESRLLYAPPSGEISPGSFI